MNIIDWLITHFCNSCPFFFSSFPTFRYFSHPWTHVFSPHLSFSLSLPFFPSPSPPLICNNVLITSKDLVRTEPGNLLTADFLLFFFAFFLFFFFSCFTFAHTDYFLHFCETRAGKIILHITLREVISNYLDSFLLSIGNGTKRRYQRDISNWFPFSCIYIPYIYIHICNTHHRPSVSPYVH